jgi:hypothetical protein
MEYRMPEELESHDEVLVYANERNGARRLIARTPPDADAVQELLFLLGLVGE